MPTYYEILGVENDCDQEEIKKAYYRQALLYHPDKNDSTDAGEKMRQLNEAYQALSDPSRRAEYDAKISWPFEYYMSRRKDRANESSKQGSGFGPFNYNYGNPWGNYGPTYGYSAPNKHYTFTWENKKGSSSIFTNFISSIMIGLAIGTVLGSLFLMPASSGTIKNVEGLAIFLLVMAIIIPPTITILFARNTINNEGEAALLGTMSVSAAIFISLIVTGIVFNDLAKYYACTCCMGPWASIFAGWLLGSRVGKILYGFFSN
jgi:hypothetical protein